MSRRHRVNSDPTPKLPPPARLSNQEILRERDRARDGWNAWASKNKEARMRYEQKFMAIDGRLDSYEKKLALENLILHEERKVFMEGATYWTEMWYWEDLAGAMQADRLIVDPTINDEPWWWKVTSGRADKIHHEYEPVKGKVFLSKKKIPNSQPTPLGSFKVTDTRASAITTVAPTTLPA